MGGNLEFVNLMRTLADTFLTFRIHASTCAVQQLLCSLLCSRAHGQEEKT